MELQSGEVLARSWQIVNSEFTAFRVDVLFIENDKITGIGLKYTINRAIEEIRKWEDGDRGKA